MNMKLEMSVLAIAGSLLFASISTQAQVPTRQQHVIMISIDGLRPAVYLDPAKEGMSLPNLVALRDSGTYADKMITVLPSVTYPSHTSLVTGTRPYTHKIVNNFRLGTMDWYLNTNEVKSETLWQAAHKAGLSTSIVTWPMSYGAQVDWLIPENLNFGLKDVPAAIKSGSTPGLYERLEKETQHFDITAFERVDGGETLDRMTTAYAAQVIRDHKPDLLLIHFLNTDHWEHFYGPYSPEAHKAFETVDAQIGEIEKAVSDAGIAGETDIVIVGDHGFVPVQTGLNINHILSAIGYAKIENGKVVTNTIDVQALGGSGAFYAKKGSTPAQIATFNSKLRDYIDTQYHDLITVLSPEQLKQKGGFPDAVCGFTIDQAGYMVVDAPNTDATVLPGLSGMHGYDPELPGMATGFIGSGPGFAAHREIPMIRTIDVAPTLATVLGVPLPEAEGISIIGVRPLSARREDGILMVIGDPNKKK